MKRPDVHRSQAPFCIKPSATASSLMASLEAKWLLRIARRDLTKARRLLDRDVEEISWG